MQIVDHNIEKANKKNKVALISMVVGKHVQSGIQYMVTPIIHFYTNFIYCFNHPKHIYIILHKNNQMINSQILLVISICELIKKKLMISAMLLFFKNLLSSWIVSLISGKTLS